MPRALVPSYRFNFPGGLTQRGRMVRVSPAIDEGRSHRFHYYLDDRLLAFPLGRRMPATLADLLDVCAAIYFVDRQALRAVDGDLRSPTERWHRRFEEVAIPVRRPDAWRSAEVRRLLGDLTAFVSDDDWTFRFDRRVSDPRPAESQGQLFPTGRESAPLAVLHSGGLDSLFGLIEAAQSGDAGTVLAVSVVTSPRLCRVTERVLAALRPGTPTVLLEELRLHVGISGIGRPLDDREPSQRTRSLLYLAAGVAAAVLAGRDTLRVTENGPGAINLPCTPDQLGARATRAMPPKTLGLFADLASVILDRRIVITNGGLFRTKGELAEVLRDGRFAAGARQTVSCERFPYRPAHRGCGTCGSCLYRRFALNAAGLSDLDGERYAAHEDAGLLDPDLQWDRHDLVPLFAQRELVERLRTMIATDRPFAALDAAFPTIDDVVSIAPTLGLTERQAQVELVRLFATYVREVDAFFARIDRRGWGRPADVTPLNVPATTAAVG